jgi:hypothetical protein
VDWLKVRALSAGPSSAGKKKLKQNFKKFFFFQIVLLGYKNTLLSVFFYGGTEV